MGGGTLILLDTHAWLWWIDGSERLGARARKAIASEIAGHGVAVSAISCWEIAMLVRKRRLELTMPVEDWIARCEALPYFTVIPIDARTAIRAAQLDLEHGDPADRLIVATALSLGATLVTKDEALSPHVRTLW